jgi:hypothetical protein
MKRNPELAKLLEKRNQQKFAAAGPKSQMKVNQPNLKKQFNSAFRRSPGK